MAVTPNFSWPTPDDSDQASQGAAAIRALGNAVDAVVGRGFLYAGTRYYTSDGTFAKADPLGTGNIGLRAIRVRVVGGGGSGGGTAETSASQQANGAGGGGGGYAEKFITDIAGLDASETVSVGDGGAGAAAGGAGVAGGTSSFSSLSCTGGGGGGIGLASAGVQRVSGGAAGVATGGDLNIDGEPGFIGFVLTGERMLTGIGGASFLSKQRAQGTGNGNAGLLFGGGAAGASSAPSTAARVSTAGAAGIVIIDCFV